MARQLRHRVGASFRSANLLIGPYMEFLLRQQGFRRGSNLASEQRLMDCSNYVYSLFFKVFSMILRAFCVPRSGCWAIIAQVRSNRLALLEFKGADRTALMAKGTQPRFRLRVLACATFLV